MARVQTRQQADGSYVHTCTACGSARANKYPRYRWRCDCEEVPPIGAGASVQPAKRPPRSPTQDDLRRKMPCAFLGVPTGKRHKVGCVDRYLPEHACLCGERQAFVYQPKRAEIKPHHVRKPVAIPDGRCRDLQAKWGEVSCLDCSFYRAGLLIAPPVD